MGTFPRIARYPVDFSQPETQVRMLRNGPKYRLFSGALARFVRGKTVLDIGTGSGILALLAVAHGASSVVAVDRETVTPMTRAVLERYRRGKLIDLWEGDIFDFRSGSAKFDVIISETIGYLGFEENIVHILSYARQHCADSSSVVMPCDMGVKLEPTRSTSGYNGQSPYLTLASSSSNGSDCSSAPKPVTLGLSASPELVIADTWRATTTVTMDAVAVYFDVGLHGTARITNKGNPNWPHCVVPLAQQLRLDEGETVTCRLRLDPSADESYRASIRVQDTNGRELESPRFESTEIRTGLLPPAPNTEDAVIQEVETVLRSLGLFTKLA